MEHHGGSRKAELIVIMGATGSGKSSFINCLVGNEQMAVGHGLKSTTASIQPLNVEMDGRLCSLIDTPGFDDTHLTDTQVLTKITDWLNITYRNGVRVTGIIYLRDITEIRMKGSALKNFFMFQKLCGTENLKNVLLVTTKWDAMDRSQAAARESELKADYLQPMIEAGANTARHDNSVQSAAEIVRQLLGNPPMVLKIQTEIVDQKKPLVQTAAGMAVNEELTKVRQELTEQYESNLQAEKGANETMRRLLEKSNAEFKAELERIDAEKKALEEGAEAHNKELSELQMKLNAAAESSGKSVQEYILDIITAAVPIIHAAAPILATAWATSRKVESVSPEPKAEREILVVEVEKEVYVDRPVESYHQGPDLLEFPMELQE